MNSINSLGGDGEGILEFQSSVKPCRLNFPRNQLKTTSLSSNGEQVASKLPFLFYLVERGGLWKVRAIIDYRSMINQIIVNEASTDWF